MQELPVLNALVPMNRQGQHDTNACISLVLHSQTTALMMLGRTLMPARWKAMTNGLCCAVPVDMARVGSL